MAIQQAIDGLPPSGGLVLVGTGTFTCTTALIIDRDSVDLRGQGPSTILRSEVLTFEIARPAHPPG